MAGSGITMPEFSRIEIAGRLLEAAHWPASSPAGTILLLHEALGSVTYWKDFPARLAAATKLNVVAYSRAGHGDSEGPVEPRTIDYYTRQISAVIPAILAHYHVEDPILYGHSEGAVIALLYASGRHSVRAAIAECPVLIQEEQTVRTIQELAAAYSTSDMGQRLGRYHRDADSVFHAWMQNNRSSLLKDFPLSQHLLQITCPVLALQGAWDEFGSIRQFQFLQQSLPGAQHSVLQAGHLLHREQPELVIQHVQAFLAKLPSPLPFTSGHEEDL